MRIAVLPLAAAAILLGAPVLAQDAATPTALTTAPATVAPPVVKAGQMVKTADGAAVGRIDEVQSASGQPVSISVIYNQHFIHIPASTLSAGPKGLITSLTARDVSRLN